jgi:PAS domain-containing protein
LFTEISLSLSLYIIRKSDNSTPQSTTSDSDDANNNSKSNNNELAVQNFERFRENSIEDTNLPTLPPPSDSIAEYCAESLYSYSFTPLSRVNKAARIKKQILNRGMDYMQRIRWRPGERDTGRRFSQPDIGVLDQTHDWVVDSPTTKRLAHHDLPPMSAPSVSHGSIIPTQSSPMPKINTAQDEVDQDGFNLARRQTLEVFNNLLPPIYEKTTRQLPCSAQYTRALHAPSRFLPQNQAILTTDDEATILLFNDIASLCFGIDKQYVGKSILDALEEPFKQQISGILKRRRHYHHHQQEKGGLVLVCGIVVPIRKVNQSDTSAAASLWLKEKITEEGKRIYIWIFEEIYETSLSTLLDDQGRIVEVNGTTKDIFGYTPEEIVGKSISELIPALPNNLFTMDKLKFYGGRSKSGVCFPIMINMSANRLKIVSLPSIAGLITVHSTGKIQSINPVPAKYLFGYSTEALVNKFDIDQIIPKFSEVVDGLKRFNLLQLASTVNNHACRWVISELCTAETQDPLLKSLERRPSVGANGQLLPIIHAVHRDGSQFEIQLQLRLIESDKENLISIWVTYDRIYAIKRAKRMVARLQQQAVSSIDNEYANLEEPIAVSPPPPPPLPIDQEQEPLPIPTHIKKRPPIKPYGISSFGSVDKKKALFPSGMDEKIKSDAIAQQDTKKSPPHPMDDYVIIGTLGEGAYGTAKLAYHKDDTTQVSS